MTGTGVFSFTVYCEACKLTSPALLPKAEVTWEARWDCAFCDGSKTVKKVMSAAKVHTRTFPDGYKRGDLQNMHASLDAEDAIMATRDEGERGRIRKEIKKMGIKSEL